MQMPDEVLDAELADGSERRLLGGEVVVEAGLSDAEPFGDVFGARTQIALLGEGGGGSAQDLAVASFPAGGGVPTGGRVRA